MAAKAKRARKSYTPEQRQQILQTADRDGLTANDVKKKFGVTPVTYYSWRKKEGLSARRGRGGASGGGARRNGGGDLSNQVRSEVRAKIQNILPEIVRSEVSSYMDSLFGPRRGRGRPRG